MSDHLLNDASTATFLFEVDGVVIGNFMEVSGLEVSIDTEDIVEGGQNSFVHKVPGRMTWPNITLKRGATRTNNLLKWLNESSGEKFTVNGNKVVRKTAAITLVDRTGARVTSWDFIDAFPIKWSGPTFAAASGEAPTEQLEIAHHGFRSSEH
jgi:phage tail-like protein